MKIVTSLPAIGEPLSKQSSTSRRSRYFTGGPQRDKDQDQIGESLISMKKTKVVTSLPCERETLSKRLRHSDFNKAETVLSKYLKFDKNEESFKKWLTESCGVSDT